MTTGLVHVTVDPPAFPETAKLPGHALPPTVVPFHVNVPENVVAVVAPLTVPFACAVLQVPDTVAPD